ncbi:MAG TPA: hypothetical protein VFB79_03125 [Candidatus Angelobacter sp.]|nr:hypothetical protein [Candidatus Angelobacter sp.]
MLRPIQTTHEWVLSLLAGNARGVAKGTVTQAQLQGTKRLALRWGVDATTVEMTLATKELPKRAGEV